MKFYLEFDKVRYVKAYDIANGVRNFGTWKCPDKVMIYNNSKTVNKLFDTIEEALAAWGEWSEKPVFLPNGSVAIPAEYLHPKC